VYLNLGFCCTDWRPKSVSRFGRPRREAVETWLAWKSLVEENEMISLAAFPWVPELERNWTTIRQEPDNVS
jgi:hypothetical protein